MGLIPGWVKPKTVKMAPVAFLLGSQYSRLELRGFDPSGDDGSNMEEKFHILWNCDDRGNFQFETTDCNKTVIIIIQHSNK